MNLKTYLSKVGYGDIYPTNWFTQLLVLFESMLSVVFTTVIFVQVRFMIGIIYNEMYLCYFL